MNTITLPPAVYNCLRDQMNLEMEHFLEEYNHFNNNEKGVINKILTQMLLDSRATSPFESDALDFNHPNVRLSHFVQVLYDCFKILNECQNHTEDELIKRLYLNPDRVVDSWAPIVVIKEPLGDYSNEEPKLTLYRGCHREEFTNNQFGVSWSTEKSTAQVFAFNYPKNKKDRVIVKATFTNKDIALIVEAGSENEVVILPDVKPINAQIVKTYSEYNKP